MIAFGVVSLAVYEGAHAITGPYLATFGAGAALVAFVTGAGEAVALVFRLFTGRLSDRTGRHWALSIAGFAITAVAVPVLAATVPTLAFTTTPALVWLGSVLWGAAMGIHASTMRAAVAELLPAARRGLGYGTFTAPPTGWRGRPAAR